MVDYSGSDQLMSFFVWMDPVCTEQGSDVSPERIERCRNIQDRRQCLFRDHEQSSVVALMPPRYDISTTAKPLDHVFLLFFRHGAGKEGEI